MERYSKNEEENEEEMNENMFAMESMFWKKNVPTGKR